MEEEMPSNMRPLSLPAAFRDHKRQVQRWPHARLLPIREGGLARVSAARDVL